MAQQDYGVTEWKRIAKALHSGALHNDVTFETTQDALNHLYYYQESYIAAVSGHDHGQYRDFCYIHKDKPCRTHQCQLKLSVFFPGVATDNRCALCNGVTMAPTADGTVAYGIENRRPWCEMSDLEQLSLKHLEHLAVYHTPYFVMLFLGSVKNKRHVLHSDQASRQELVLVIYSKYGHGETPLTFHDRQNKDITFLKLWWRYTNRQSSKVLNLKIPYYLEMPNTTTHGTWNPVHDKFADRTPEPLYSFVKSACICRDVWCEDDAYNAPLCSSPTLQSVARANDNSVVYSLQTPVPKLHINTVLDATVTTYNTRDWESLGMSLPCCKPLAPRLDSLVLEESVDCTVLSLRAIVSLHEIWIPLESWLSPEHCNDNPILPVTRHRVAAGVLGCFRDIYEKNTVPPRQLYATHRDLIKTLLVNTRTWDVMSLLPYVCMNKMYRAVNSAADETSLRKACCGIMVQILLPLTGDVESAVDSWWSSDASDSADTIESQFLLLCKEGFRDLSTWDALQPESFGVRCMSIVDGGYVWLGDSVTDDSVMRDRLSEIGLTEPVRVTVIEIPPKQTVPSEGSLTAPIHRPGTRVLECFRGLASALTVNAMCVSMPNDMIIRRHEFRRSQASNNAYHGPGKRPLAPDSGSDPQDNGSARPKMSYVETHTDEPIIIELMNFPHNNDTHNITFPSIGDNVVPSEPCHSISFSFDSRLFDTGTSLADVDDLNAGYPLMAHIEDLDTIDASALMLHNATNHSYDIVAPMLNMEVDGEEVDGEEVDSEEVDGEEVDPYDVTSFDVNTMISSLFPNVAADKMHVRNGEDCDILALSNTDKRKKQTVAPQCEQMGGCDDTPAGPSHGEPTQAVHDVRLESPVSGDSARRAQRNPLPTDDASAIELPDSVLYPSEYTSDEPEVLRATTEADLRFLDKVPKWRSNGVQYSHLNDARYGTTHSPYFTMAFTTAFEIQKHKGYATKLMLRKTPDTPQTNPTVGLEKVVCTHGCDANAQQASDVYRTAVEDINSNYIMGIYVCSRLTRKFTRPKEFTYTRSDIPSVTINCKTGARVYYAVDLSKPPERGFRYVCLHVNEFPIGMRIDSILDIKSTEALYLGHVLTTQNVAGLLIHRIFSEDAELLETVLDMHTRLQIHPFVARTFALHLMKMPFTDTGITGAFVGEHVGEWNLGSPDGLANMTDSQKCTLAYHVTTCLIKAQILTMSILGFPLLRLHPGRIWRDGARFKVDLLACLLDHITSKLISQVCVRKNAKEDFDSPIAPVPGGVRAITDTLRTLDLDRFVPQWENLPDYHNDYENDVPDGDIEVFYSMYEQLTQQDVRDVHILSLLGECETYQPFTVPTANCRSAPFAPFHVQIHNQYVKWNKVIIVEPVQAADALPLPTLIPQRSSKNKQRSSLTTRRRSSTTTRIPAREPNETAPAQRQLPAPRPSKSRAPRRSISTPTPAVSQARASRQRADAVSLPRTPPSLETEQPPQPASPVPDTERNHSYVYALNCGVDYMNTRHSVYYD